MTFLFDVNDIMCHMYAPDSEYEPLSGFYGYEEGLEISAANIRTWIHEKDLACLERVVWEGHGSLLLGQMSNNHRVRKFLEAVPKLMNEIQTVHEAAVEGEMDNLRGREFRQPVYTSKDVNSISAFHKAVANGHLEVAEHLMEKTDRAVLELTDDLGRTALHYAAGRLARLEDDVTTSVYHWLIDMGADEVFKDDFQRAADYYLDHGDEIKFSSCSFVPDAPRIKERDEHKASMPRRGGRFQATYDPDLEDNNRVGRENKPKLPTWDKITREHMLLWVMP